MSCEMLKLNSTAASWCGPMNARSARRSCSSGRAVGLGDVTAPSHFGLAPILRVHDEEFVEFLSSAWTEWVATGNLGEAIPDCWPARRMVQRRPERNYGKTRLLRDGGRNLDQCRFMEAARAAADVALTAARHVHQGHARRLPYAGRRGIMRRAICTAATAF